MVRENPGKEVCASQMMAPRKTPTAQSEKECIAV
jgi:hypothetical protein